MNKISYVNIAAQYQEHREEILAKIDEILASGHYIMGDEVNILEENFQRLCGVKHAIGVANGTESLSLIMRVLGIGAGDEVITAPNSWFSSASSIVHVGATPVFCDVARDQNMNPALLEKAITKKTKAIMPVHLTGRMADMNPIMEIARKHKIPVIEDAAQAVGAKYHGKVSGSIGDFGSFSLHPLKNLNAAGDAGLITTDNDEWANELRLLRNHGLVNRNHIIRWGYNSRLDTLQAGIINVKMKYLHAINEKRRHHADLYRRELNGLVECPEKRADCYDVYHLFVIQCDHRDELMKFLKENEIGTAIHYPVPIHLYECAKELGYTEGSFPETMRQSQRILSLPVHQSLKDEEVIYICQKIKEFYKNK